MNKVLTEVVDGKEEFLGNRGHHPLLVNQRLTCKVPTINEVAVLTDLRAVWLCKSPSLGIPSYLSHLDSFVISLMMINASDTLPIKSREVMHYGRPTPSAVNASLS